MNEPDHAGWITGYPVATLRRMGQDIEAAKGELPWFAREWAKELARAIKSRIKKLKNFEKQ